MANEDIFHLGIKVLITNPDGNILLLKGNPAELSGFKGEPYWDIPGGRIKKGDSIETTLEREVLEETGLQLQKRSFTNVGATISNIRIPLPTGEVGLIRVVFKCLWEETPIIQLSTDHTEAWWATPEEAQKGLTTKYPSEFISLIK